MLRALKIGLEFDNDPDLEAAVLDTARCWDLYEVLSHESSETLAMLWFHGGRRRGRVERVADEMQNHFNQTGLPCCVYVDPAQPFWWRRLKETASLAWWVFRHPHDPDRQHNLYIIRSDAGHLLRSLAPFERCDCGKFTRLFWRRRDPHYRNGKWVGPDCGLPF